MKERLELSQRQDNRDIETGLYLNPQLIYVAGRASYGLEPVREIYNELEKLGHSITFKWAEIEDVHKPYRDHKDDPNNQLLAREGLRGARQADVCILIADEGLWGALTEWGAFLSSCQENSDGRLGYIVGATARQSVFDVLPFVRVVESIDQVFDELDFLDD